MNRYWPLLTPAAVALLAAPAVAGGLDALLPQPVVLPAMQVTAGAYDWTGGYAGISAGTTRTKQQRPAYAHRPMNKAELHDRINALGGCGSPGTLTEYTLVRGEESWVSGCESIGNNAPDAGWAEWQVVGETASEQSGTETARSSHTTWGLFAGYRHQFTSDVVLGAEAAWHRAATDQIEAKAQAGFAFGRALPFITAGWEFEGGEALYGVGIDYGLTSRITVGSEYARFGDIDRLTARIGWRF